MIDLKRNTKGEYVEATGLNSQKWRIYKQSGCRGLQFSGFISNGTGF